MSLFDVTNVRKYIKPKADSTLNNMRKAELIEYIRTLEHNYNVACSFNENQAKYIESLQKPTKPYYRKEEDTKGYACPVCDMGVTADHGRIRDTFCSHCGQKLNWEGV